MKRVGSSRLKPLVFLLFLAIANLNFVNAQAQKALQPVAQAGGKTHSRPHQSVDAPEDLVVCTGWHALCSASPDCKVKGNKADCDCMRVNETHVVETNEIQDRAVKRQTLATCTKEHPCGVDQAPICKAIRNGQYRVGGVKYDWVSTYSYRGWCSLLQQQPIACDQRAKGYAGNSKWAICDVAPCTEKRNPSDPNRPLSCQCRVENTPFVGLGSCTGKNGGIISSMPIGGWDFKRKTYTFHMPGYEYVQGACEPVTSDLLTAPRRAGKSR